MISNKRKIKRLIVKPEIDEEGKSEKDLQSKLNYHESRS